MPAAKKRATGQRRRDAAAGPFPLKKTPQGPIINRHPAPPMVPLRFDGLPMARPVVLLLALICGGLPGGAAHVLADDPAAEARRRADEDVAFFETKIRPLFVERCHKCHGPEKQTSGLRLDTRAGIL